MWYEDQTPSLGKTVKRLRYELRFPWRCVESGVSSVRGSGVGVVSDVIVPDTHHSNEVEVGNGPSCVVVEDGVVRMNSSLSWSVRSVGVVIIGLPVLNDLKGRVSRVKSHLSRPPTSEENRVLCASVVSRTGTGGDGDNPFLESITSDRKTLLSLFLFLVTCSLYSNTFLLFTY